MIDQQGNPTGEVSLSDVVFGAKPKEHLLFDVVLMQRASKRQGSANTKCKAEVRGGGRKPFRQKGTGSARQGSIRSPLMVGGGTVFGPTPRDFSYRVPRKVRRQALRVALSQRQREGKLFVVDRFSLESPKTKTILAFLKKLNVQKALVVDSSNDKLARSVRNLATAKYLDVKGLNVFDILKYEILILTSVSLDAITKEYSA